MLPTLTNVVTLPTTNLTRQAYCISSSFHAYFCLEVKDTETVDYLDKSIWKNGWNWIIF